MVGPFQLLASTARAIRETPPAALPRQPRRAHCHRRAHGGHAPCFGERETVLLASDGSTRADGFNFGRDDDGGVGRQGEAAGLREVCLLIVDDDPDWIFVLQRVLGRALPADELPSILTASSPQHAFDWLTRLDADCLGLMVLADFDLKAERTGMELLCDVAERWARTTRVLMSGSPPGQIPPWRDHSIHAFIPKDAPREEISAELKKWLQHAKGPR